MRGILEGTVCLTWQISLQNILLFYLCVYHTVKGKKGSLSEGKKKNLHVLLYLGSMPYSSYLYCTFQILKTT